MSSTIVPEEITQFQKDSAHWWDENGPFKPLHMLNPVRIQYIKQQICDHFDRDMNDLKALKGLNIIDVGCGGGLVCEPLARLGGKVTGLDADTQAIAVAKEHAIEQNLKIIYENKDLAKITKKYDVVLALEIIEHVAEPQEFINQCAKILKPGGLIIFSTLNRTPKSYALGIIAAEHLLRWVPKSTHDWQKFIKPSEFVKMARSSGLEAYDITGLIFNPLKNQFQLSRSDLDVNYLLSCRKS